MKILSTHQTGTWAASFTAGNVMKIFTPCCCHIVGIRNRQESERKPGTVPDLYTDLHDLHTIYDTTHRPHRTNHHLPGPLRPLQSRKRLRRGLG